VKLIVFRKNYPNGKDILPLAFFINAILSKQYNLSDLGTVSGGLGSSFERFEASYAHAS